MAAIGTDFWTLQKAGRLSSPLVMSIPSGSFAEENSSEVGRVQRMDCGYPLPLSLLRRRKPCVCRSRYVQNLRRHGAHKDVFVPQRFSRRSVFCSIVLSTLSPVPGPPSHIYLPNRNASGVYVLYDTAIHLSTNATGVRLYKYDRIIPLSPLLSP